MTGLPEPIQQRLMAHLDVRDYDGAIAMIDETYPASPDKERVPERVELFDRLACHAMDHADPRSVMKIIGANGHEFSLETLGDIAVDPEWSELLQPPVLAD